MRYSVECQGKTAVETSEIADDAIPDVPTAAAALR